MRALLRYTVAPLVLAAAAFSVVVPAQLPAAAAASHVTKFVPRDCPAGTSWNNVLQACG